jgi:hypothetical protein
MAQQHTVDIDAYIAAIKGQRDAAQEMVAQLQGVIAVLEKNLKAMSEGKVDAPPIVT